MSDDSEEMAEIARRLLDIPYSPQTPHDAQARFLLDFRLEVLFGGSVGPGKSSAVLMGALQFIDVPGYAALILRKNLTELNMPGALMHRAQEWFRTHSEVVWQEQKKRFVFPSGAIIQFGFLERSADRARYASAEFQYIGVDELGELKRDDYLFLFSRLRRPKDVDGSNPLSKVPLRMRGASNPGALWLYERFVADPDDETEEFEFEEDRDRTSRGFVPATLDDNPFLDVEEYEKALKNLDPITRRQLRNGEWKITLRGNVLDREWFPIVPTAPAQIIKTVRYWDLAATAEEQAAGKDPDWTCGALCHRLIDNRMVVADIIKERKSPAEIEGLLIQTAEADGPFVDVWVEQEPGSGGKIAVNHIQRNVLPNQKVKAHPTRVDKVTAAQGWAALAGNQRGVLILPGRFVAKLFDQMQGFPGAGHDDMIDAVSGAHFALFGKTSGLSRIARPGMHRDQAERERAAERAQRQRDKKPDAQRVIRRPRSKVFKRESGLQKTPFR